MRASLDQAMGTAHGLSHNADLGCYMEYNEQVIMTLANEVKRLQAEIKLQNKDWCDDDEAIKKQALRVLPKVMIEGDSCHVPFMSEVAEMMADEIERLRIWNKRWRDIAAKLRLTLAELVNKYET